MSLGSPRWKVVHFLALFSFLFLMLQNMYFGRKLFTWSHLYLCVVDFRKVESTLFHDSSILIGTECIKIKMGISE